MHISIHFNENIDSKPKLKENFWIFSDRVSWWVGAIWLGEPVDELEQYDWVLTECNKLIGEDSYKKCLFIMKCSEVIDI